MLLIGIAVTAAPAAADDGGIGSPQCAVKSDGTVWCWGRNDYGQIGNGTTSFAQPAPVQVTGITDAVAADAAFDVACALRSSGRVACWGRNDHGQLGDGGTEDSALPVTVAGLEDAVVIAVGDAYSCARRATAQVVCWGLDSGLIEVPTMTGAERIAVTDTFGCAVTPGGRVRCGGQNEDGQLGDGSNDPTGPDGVEVQGITGAVDVDVAYPLGEGSTACAVVGGGQVRCWGSNVFGMLGGGSDAESSNVPVGVVGVTDATSVRIYATQACATLESGAVTCWGGADLAHAVFTELGSLPGAVPGISDAARLFGRFTPCAVRQTGGVSCWGYSAFGETGSGRHSYTVTAGPGDAVAGLDGAPTAISTDDSHGCALSATNELRCWGLGPFGRSDGEWTHVADGAEALNGGSDIESVSVSEEFGCAVKLDETVVCLGMNDNGQLGDGSGDAAFVTPVAVDGLTAVAEVATGKRAACAVKSDGTVWCWGRVPAADDLDVQATPVQVGGISDARSVAMGDDGSACVLLGDGHVNCWGHGEAGQLGDGLGQSSDAPVEVAGLSDAASVVVGSAYGCAARDTGAVVCWGRGEDGQLGDGERTSSLTPVEVDGLSDVTQLSAGHADITCALTSDRHVHCWGSSMGVDFRDVIAVTPQEVAGVSDATHVDAGGVTCILRLTGQVRCWGIVLYGGIGDGPGPSGHGRQPPTDVPGMSGFCQSEHCVAGPDEATPDDDPPNEAPPDARLAPVAQQPQPPSTVESPVPQVRWPSVPRVPQVRLSGRRLTLTRFTLTRTGRRCPTRVRVSVWVVMAAASPPPDTGAGPVTDPAIQDRRPAARTQPVRPRPVRTVTMRTSRVAGGCRVNGRLTLAKRHSSAPHIAVAVSGTGIKTRKMTARR